MSLLNKRHAFQRTVLLLLSLILLMQVFVSCNGNNGGGDGTSDGQEETQASTEPVQEYLGYLDGYSLVRAAVNVCSEAICIGQKLEAVLSDVTGKTVKAQVDTRSKDNAEVKEILLGITNRSASVAATEALGKDEFSITVDGNKIVIVGSNALALDRAADYFIEKCIYGIESVSQLRNYREQRKDESIELSELREFGYSDRTAIYAGGIQQDFALDLATGDIYYSTGGGNKALKDKAICRVMPSGHQEYMIINNFGHVETMEIERTADGKVYIWTTSQGHSGDNDFNYAISRFEFVPGTTCDWQTGQTFELKDGDRYNYPCIDLENRYVGNWTGSEMYIYDMDRLLDGKYALLTVVDVSFPFEGYSKRIGCGFDISGSYLYGAFYWEKDGRSGFYAVEFDLEGNVTNWTTIKYRPQGAEKYLELNGIKVERINGVNRVFVGLCSFNTYNNRYAPTISYFAEREIDPGVPTIQSTPLITKMEYTTLPQNAQETPWTCQDGVFSVSSDLEQRLIFNEAGFDGESYRFETTVSMKDASYAGIALGAATNTCRLEELYSMNTFIGIKITVSADGVLTISAYNTTKTYNVTVGEHFVLQTTLSADGTLTVSLDGKEYESLLMPPKYVGGHVGCLAKGGNVSFSDTTLTYLS